MNQSRQATIIKIGAVITATPRWVAALLLAEGFILPADWLVWWIPVSAILSAGMAITEALAFAFIFEAWRNQSDKKSNILLAFAAVAAFIFIAVVAPYIVASVNGLPLHQVLSGMFLWLWAASVAASTIVIVAAVGYAQKFPRHTAQPRKVSGNLPEEPRNDDGIKHDWRTLPDEDKTLIAAMSSSEIVNQYGVSERTARNWRSTAKTNGKVKA